MGGILNSYINLRLLREEMKFRKIATAVVAISFAAFSYAQAGPLNAGNVTTVQATSSGPLQAGVGVVDITPTTLPVALAGPPSKELATTIDTRLYVKALVFLKEGKKVAIVTVDTYKYELVQANNARRTIAAATGIPFSNIIISASETHRGPFWSYYPDHLVTPIIRAVTLAMADLGPVTLSAAKGEVDGVSENRRVIKDGTAWGRWQLPPAQQNSYPTEGPIDTTINVLAVTSAKGTYKALLYNFACKGSNTRAFVVSADFPGDTQQYIQGQLGYAVPALFLDGPSGDIDPVAQDLAYPVQPQQVMGDTIGKAIVGAMPRLEPIANPTLKLENWEIQMPGRENPFFAGADITLKWHGQYQHFLDSFNQQMKLQKPSYQFFMTGISIGNDFAIITSPGELFSKYGLDIKAQSPFKYTMVAIDANGSYGYIPTVPAFAEGGYETWFGIGSYLTQQAGNIDEKDSVEILNHLKGL